MTGSRRIVPRLADPRPAPPRDDHGLFLAPISPETSHRVDANLAGPDEKGSRPRALKARPKSWCCAFSVDGAVQYSVEEYGAQPDPPTPHAEVRT